MAPIKSTKGKGKSGKPASKAGGASKKSTRAASGSGPSGISKRKAKSMALAKPGGAQKTKTIRTADGKKKKRVYTEAELDIPKLNSIVPAGIAKPKGQKKGKKFVDDPESMMAIMSVVNAEKEGHLESKIMRARQLEEVREAKRKEAEKRSDEKAARFEEKKNSLKKSKKRRASEGAVDTEEVGGDEIAVRKEGSKGKKKRVSFG